MSNNKNNRWIFWAPLDDAAKQKAHILVEMDARVSIYGAIIYKILQSGVYFRTLFILAHKVICKKNPNLLNGAIVLFLAPFKKSSSKFIRAESSISQYWAKVLYLHINSLMIRPKIVSCTPWSK